MPKCENCLHKKDCIDGVNFKNAESCKRFALSDSAIIKALECCVLYKQICPETCPMVSVRQCQFDLKKNAFDLINRQQAEIKKLQEHIKKCDTVEQRADELIAQLQKELKTAKSEAVKEFAERLKKKSYPFPCAIGVENAVTIRAINDLVEEMGGDDK